MPLPFSSTRGMTGTLVGGDPGIAESVKGGGGHRAGTNETRSAGGSGGEKKDLGSGDGLLAAVDVAGERSEGSGGGGGVVEVHGAACEEGEGEEEGEGGAAGVGGVHGGASV